MLHPLLFALVVVLIALVGKAFCAWMCPVPWLQSFSVEEKEFESDERFKKQAEPFVLRCPGATTRAAKRWRRWAASATACSLTVAMRCWWARWLPRPCSAFRCFASSAPWVLTFATIIGLWNLVQFDEPTWALIIFPDHPTWKSPCCANGAAKFCPISALVSLLSNLNVTLRPRVKADTCLRSRGVDCHACVDACPEQLDPHTKRIPECSKCGALRGSLPAKAISVKLLK